jgi:ABC-type dipeptide transport system, periplasmic component
MRRLILKPLTKRAAAGFMGKALLALLMLSLAAGCAQTPTAQPTQQPGADTPATPAPPTPTATAVPPKVLTVCLAEEPASLYRYDGHAGGAKDTIFAALYDGPFELSADGTFAESILSAYPSRENGGVSSIPTAVQPGDMVVDAYGELRVFKAGIFVRPAGCTSSECAVKWESGEFQMDQTRVEFQLRTDGLWSDGERLTAEDAVFSYATAKQAELPAGAWALDRTISLRRRINKAQFGWACPAIPRASSRRSLAAAARAPISWHGPSRTRRGPASSARAFGMGRLPAGQLGKRPEP